MEEIEVKIARIKKGLTQAQVCKLVNISPRKMVEIERGNYNKITLQLAKKIAAVLDCNVLDLFFNEDN